MRLSGRATRFLLKRPDYKHPRYYHYLITIVTWWVLLLQSPDSLYISFSYINCRGERGAVQLLNRTSIRLISGFHIRPLSRTIRGWPSGSKPTQKTLLREMTHTVIACNSNVWCNHLPEAWTPDVAVLTTTAAATYETQLRWRHHHATKKIRDLLLRVYYCILCLFMS